MKPGELGRSPMRLDMFISNSRPKPAAAMASGFGRQIQSKVTRCQRIVSVVAASRLFTLAVVPMYFVT